MDPGPGEENDISMKSGGARSDEESSSPSGSDMSQSSDEECEIWVKFQPARSPRRPGSTDPAPKCDCRRATATRRLVLGRRWWRGRRPRCLSRWESKFPRPWTC